MTDHYHIARAELMAPGSPFAIIDAEVGGVTMKTFAATPPNLRMMWEGASKGFTDRLYLVYEDEHFTFNDIAGDVRALAHYLHGVGIGEGDRVAVAMRNYPEWVTAYWAVVSIGAAVVGMNAWWTSPEMEYGLTDSGPKVLIADQERLERVVPILDTVRSQQPLRLLAVRTTGELPAGADRWEDVVQRESAPAELPPATIDTDDDACIFYTSGTTGFPKGAQLTHRGSIANIYNMAFMQAAVNSADARPWPQVMLRHRQRHRLPPPSAPSCWSPRRSSTSPPTTAGCNPPPLPADASC